MTPIILALNVVEEPIVGGRKTRGMYCICDLDDTGISLALSIEHVISSLIDLHK